MTDVDLNDLRIEHGRIGARRGLPFLAVLVIFVLGGAVGFGIREYTPLFQGRDASQDQPKVPAEGAPTDPETPAPAPSPQSFTEGGWIEVPSYHPLMVTSLIAGRLDELNVLEGSRVEEGEVIARLYAKDLEDAVERAEAEVSAAAAQLERLQAGFRVQEVGRARADLEAAIAEVELRRQVLERTRGLLESGVATAEELERHEAALRSAEASRESLRQELLLKEEGSRKEDIAAAKAELRRRLALLELARNQLAYTVIKSPAAGVVLERFVTRGTWIQASNPRIVSLYDPTDLQVRVDVRQENIAAVFVGQKVQVFTEVEPGRTYLGTVIRVDPLADFKKNTVQVKVKLDETSERLYPEMIARIRFMLRKKDARPDRDG